MLQQPGQFPLGTYDESFGTAGILQIQQAGDRVERHVIAVVQGKYGFLRCIEPLIEDLGNSLRRRRALEHGVWRVPIVGQFHQEIVIPVCSKLRRLPGAGFHCIKTMVARDGVEPRG